MQGSKAMLKPGVSGTGIYIICKTQLLDVSQSLYPGMLDKIKDEITGNIDKAINRIIYYFPFICTVIHVGKVHSTKIEITSIHYYL